MKESTTYQAIVEEGKAVGRDEGRLIEAKAILLRLGAAKFGLPDAASRAQLESNATVERLERLLDRILISSSWPDLLSQP